jgi:hypothetical protein
MRSRAKGIQYTIRGVSPAVDKALREKASRTKRSLNQVVLDELAAVTVERKRRVDFSDVVGTWELDPEFGEILAAQRQIDPEGWR